MVFEITCSACGGAGCVECSGGRVAYHRCPRAVCQQGGRDLALFIEAYAALDAHHILPQAGGWCDQSGQFLRAVAIANDERARWDQLAEEVRARRSRA